MERVFGEERERETEIYGEEEGSPERDWCAQSSVSPQRGTSSTSVTLRLQNDDRHTALRLPTRATCHTRVARRARRQLTLCRLPHSLRAFLGLPAPFIALFLPVASRCTTSPSRLPSNTSHKPMPATYAPGNVHRIRPSKTPRACHKTSLSCSRPVRRPIVSLCALPGIPRVAQKYPACPKIGPLILGSAPSGHIADPRVEESSVTHALNQSVSLCISRTRLRQSSSPP